MMIREHDYQLNSDRGAVTPPMDVKNKDINELIRGEMSASRAYGIIRPKIKKRAEADRLQQFQADHEAAVDFWRQQSRQAGSIPDFETGVWGHTVEAFAGVSKLFGETRALRALKAGEEYGLKKYKEMLASEFLSSTQKTQIRETFIPQQKKHLQSLDAMLKFH